MFPRDYSRSRRRFFDDQMCRVSTRCNNAPVEDLGNDLCRLARTIDAIVGGLVRGKALRMQGAEAGFVAKERSASHGQAAREQNFDGRIEPEDGSASGTEKLGATRLRVRAATEGENGSFFRFGSAAESGTELIGFHLAESGFAEALENFRNGEAGGFFDAIIEIDETPSELAGKQISDCRLAGAHETGETQDLEAGLRPAQRR